MGASSTDAGLSGTEVLVVAVSAAAVFTVAKPGVGASAAVAGASGVTTSGATCDRTAKLKLQIKHNSRHLNTSGALA